MAGRHDEDLGVLDVMLQVARPRVAHGDRGVLAEEQERRWHADDRRPADHDRAPALDLDPDRRRISTAACAVAGRNPS